MKFGVIVFPGSNCDHDAYHVISKHVGQPVDFIWHRDTNLNDYDAVILPGGFSYGDYLRAGALASFSPVMSSVREFAARGRLVLGICNGFQILCEAGLLPGALMRNRDLHYICEHVHVRVETTETPFTNQLEGGPALRIPIAHAEGNYVWTTRLLTSWSAKTASSFATATSAERSRTPRTRTARATQSPESATASATCSDSCRTRNAPAKTFWLKRRSRHLPLARGHARAIGGRSRSSCLRRDE